MAKPKLLYLATSLNIGGTENFLVQLATSFGSAYDIEIGYLKAKGLLGEELAKQGFAVTGFSSPLDLLQHLRRRRFDIVQTFLYRAHIVGRVCGRIAGVPNIISTQQAVDTWKSALLSVADRLTAPLCTCIITNSHAASQSLMRREKINAAKLRVIYNGIDFRRFNVPEDREDIRKELGAAPGTPVVFSTMRLHHDKGADYLPSIAAKVPGALFVVAGDGPERAAIEKEVAARRLGGRIKLLGWRKDIPRLLKAADMFILPSREESFPQALLEAMAMALPVVAADVGGVRELVVDGSTGYAVTPGDMQKFAEALNGIIVSAGLRAAMGQAGYARSREFSEERMLSEMNSVYQSILSTETK